MFPAAQPIQDAPSYYAARYFVQRAKNPEDNPKKLSQSLFKRLKNQSLLSATLMQNVEDLARLIALPSMEILP
ncbi:hypothetical protein N8295_04000 [Pseudomonadales bacterium]|nr:hypothetical protein [Pseudomonadales bacterium]